jgi:hypothetical protein
VTLTVDEKSISGTVTLVEETKYPAADAADTFSYSAKAIYLPKGAVVSL